jgi:DNA-binding MarR family transcriptional regulator
MARRSSAKRSALLEELLLQARRSGSLGTLHNRAAADLAGLNETDWECLDVLDWTGPITAGELAKRVGITSGAATGAIDRLEAVGLVKRVADPKDRRKVIVELQAPAPAAWSSRHRAMARCYGALEADVAEINDSFSDAELEATARWLRLSSEAIERSIDRMRAAASDAAG